MLPNYYTMEINKQKHNPICKATNAVEQFIIICQTNLKKIQSNHLGVQLIEPLLLD